jgi:TonB family protein
VTTSTSPPGTYWPDVFVQRPLPWKELSESGLLHICAVVLIALTGDLWVGRSRVSIEDPLTHTTVSYYKTEDFLPAFETPKPEASRHASSKHDPVKAPQEIISVPSDADNGEQTIVNLAHPELLRRTAPLPNLVMTPPQPKFEAEVPKLEAPAMAFKPAMPNIQPAPQEVRPEAVPVEAKEIASDRKQDLALKDSNAPDMAKLRVPSQSAMPQVEAPATKLAPPSPTIASGGSSSGAAAQLMALNARPVDAPKQIAIPDGSRKGAFATSPLGQLGAAGTPGVEANVQLAREISGGRTRTLGGSSVGEAPGTIPQGIQIKGPQSQELASAIGPTSTVTVQRAAPRVVADPVVNSTLAAAARADIPRHLPPPKEERKPTDEVFGTKHVYSMQINLPNLTSAGGSWIIRFAEMTEHPVAGELSTPVATSKVDPAYPQALQQDGVQGVVVLYAVIHANGTVGEIRVIHGLHQRLDENAIKALSRWKFRPATKNGEPVDLEAVVQIPFYARRVGF